MSSNMRFDWAFLRVKYLTRYLEDRHATGWSIVSISYVRFWFRRSVFVVWQKSVYRK